MKIELELNIVGPGVEYLNYWDSVLGQDVIAQIIDGKLFLAGFDGDGNELPLRQVSLVEYIHLVVASEMKGNDYLSNPPDKSTDDGF